MAGLEILALVTRSRDRFDITRRAPEDDEPELDGWLPGRPEGGYREGIPITLWRALR